MKIGLLWYDDQGSVAERIQRAAACYTRKYGRTPDTCYHNPQETGAQVDGLAVKPSPLVMPKHYWIGVDA